VQNPFSSISHGSICGYYRLMIKVFQEINQKAGDKISFTSEEATGG
jgi:hypothetical protein